MGPAPHWFCHWFQGQLRALELRTHSHSHSALALRAAGPRATLWQRGSARCAPAFTVSASKKRKNVGRGWSWALLPSFSTVNGAQIMSGCTTDRSFVSFCVVEDRDVLLSWYITDRKYKKMKRSFSLWRKFVMLLKKVPRFLRPLSKGMTSPRCSSSLLQPLNHQEWMWTSSCQLGKFVSSSVCLWPTLSASLPRRIKAILVNSHGGMHLRCLLREQRRRRRQAASLKRKE